jgi:transcriptional regulator with XRE-family HTH domain
MMSKRPSEIAAERIRQLRQRHGMSQQQLADRLGTLGSPLDRVAIAKLETGQRRLPLDEALLFALALDVAPASLFLPRDGGNDDVQLAGEVTVTAAQARRWLAGQEPLDGQDARIWFAEAPDEVMAAALDGARRWQARHPELHREAEWTEGGS